MENNSDGNQDAGSNNSKRRSWDGSEPDLATNSNQSYNAQKPVKDNKNQDVGFHKSKRRSWDGSEPDLVTNPNQSYNAQEPVKDNKNQDAGSHKSKRRSWDVSESDWATNSIGNREIEESTKVDPHNDHSWVFSHHNENLVKKLLKFGEQLPREEYVRASIYRFKTRWVISYQPYADQTLLFFPTSLNISLAGRVIKAAVDRRQISRKARRKNQLRQRWHQLVIIPSRQERGC
jgi:hypothetical protein